MPEDRIESCMRCGENYDPALNDCWGRMCPSCADEHFICENCGAIYHDDDYSTEGLCRFCDSTIKPYHTGPKHGLSFLPNDSHALYFGVELETENYCDRADASHDILHLSEDERLFWLEEDASLDAGFELITQPATLDFHKQSFPWSDVCRTLRNNGAKAETSGRSALHIHLSKKFFGKVNYAPRVLRLIYLFDRFRRELIQTAQTSNYLAYRSALPYYDRGFSDILAYTNSNRRLDCLRDQVDRYMAVNLQSKKKTIELRIFRSTLDPRRIIAYLELADYLARLACTLTTDEVKHLSWKRIVEGSKHNGYQELPSFIYPKRIVCRKARRRRQSEIQVGDFVRICVPEGEETTFGRAGIRNIDVGRVTETRGDTRVSVDFPSYFVGSWLGRASELEVIEGGTTDGFV